MVDRGRAVAGDVERGGVWLPEVVGANATSTVQVAFGASGWVHVLLGVVYCAASLPASWTEEMVSVADPEFVTTKVWGVLVVPAR